MANSPNRNRRRRWVILSNVVVVAIFVWWLPTIIAKTSIRDSVLNAIANTNQYELSSRSASLDWFGPLVVEDLVIAKTDGTSTLEIEKLVAEKSWLALWASSPNLGSFTITRPQLDVVVDARDAAVQDDDSLPTFTAVVENAHVVVRNKKGEPPEIDVDNISFTTHLETIDSVDLLSLEPIQIFDHLKLTPEFCNSGLQLVAPVLENEINVQGSMSLELTKFRWPLGTSQSRFVELAEINGLVELHELSAGIKNEMTKRLARMFADLFKLGEMPDEWKLTNEARVTFELRNGRVLHEGLAIVLPDISSDFSVRTSGLVSLDDRVEVTVSANLPLSLLGDTDLAKKIAQTTIEIRIAGSTLDPKTGLPLDPKWVVELSDDLTSDSLNPEEKELADDMIKLIARLLKECGDMHEMIPEPLMVRIRSLERGSAN